MTIVTPEAVGTATINRLREIQYHLDGVRHVPAWTEMIRKELLLSEKKPSKYRIKQLGRILDHIDAIAEATSKHKQLVEIILSATDTAAEK